MELTLSVFTQLLIPQGIAPSKEFNISGILYYSKLPSIEVRANVRFIMHQEDIQFLPQKEELISQLIKYWRTQLAPELDDQQSIEIFNEEELADSDSDAPVIRLVNHLFDRALDLKASSIIGMQC